MPTIDINKEYKKFEREFMEIENNLLVNYPMTLWEIALHLDKKSDDKVILKVR